MENETKHKTKHKKLRTNWNKPGKNLSSASYVGRKGSKQIRQTKETKLGDPILSPIENQCDR